MTKEQKARAIKLWKRYTPNREICQDVKITRAELYTLVKDLDRKPVEFKEEGIDPHNPKPGELDDEWEYYEEDEENDYDD